MRFIGYPEPYVSNTWTDWQAHANELMNEAQNDPSIRYVVTYGHRPAYSTGYHAGDVKLASILDGLGATFPKFVLNINGHSHNYERFQPISGVTHITDGAASSVETPYCCTDSRSVFRALHLAHLRVDVSATGMRLQAVCDDPVSNQDISCAAGSVLDEYTIGTPPPPPPASTVYVDNTNPGCSDTGPGDVSQPFCTIGKGTSRLTPGGTVYVGNGTYPEQVSVPASGTPSAQVTVAALPGAAPVVGTGAQVHGVYLANRSYVTVSGLTVSGSSGDGVYVTGCDHVTLSGMRATGSGLPNASQFAKGFKLIGTTNSTVSASTADHNTDSGIYLAQGSTGNLVVGNQAYNNARQYIRAAPGIDLRSGANTVLDNVTHDNEDSGIAFLMGSNNSLVRDNVLYNNGDHGIDNYRSTGQRIIGNTVYKNVAAGINVEAHSTGARIANNISVENGVRSPRTNGDVRVESGSTAGTTMDYDLVYRTSRDTILVWNSVSYASLAAFKSATGQEAHGRQRNPRFRNAAGGDFHLNGHSPAIDSANSAVRGQPRTDVDGNARWDDPAVRNTGVGPRRYDDRGANEFRNSRRA